MNFSITVVAGLAISTAGCRRPEPPPTDWRTAVISVRVDSTKPSGGAWDGPGADELPDPAVCVAYGSAKKCYPNGGPRITAAACANAFFCDIAEVQVPTHAPFDIEVWDVDGTSHDRVCTVECSFGRTCNAPTCSVAVDVRPTPLGGVAAPVASSFDASAVPSAPVAGAPAHDPKHYICPMAASRAIKRMDQCGLNTSGFSPTQLCKEFDYDTLSLLGSRSCTELKATLKIR